jgi:lipid A ethanolaminephosphotransferase
MKKPSAYWGPWQLSSNTTAFMIVVFLVVTANLAFWKNYFSMMPVHDFSSFALAVSMASIITGMIAVMFGLVGFKYLLKPAFALLAIFAASAAYFMDRYGAMVDRHALQSVFETDIREGSEWLSWRMLMYFALIAGIPILFLCRTEIHYRPWTRELLARVGYFTICFALMLVPAGLMYQSIASLARNHPEIRHQINPYNVIMASRNYLYHSVNSAPVVVAGLGLDAKKGKSYDNKKPKLLVLVIGESARAESFSLGAYARQTNPLLSKQAIYYFKNVSSCGTNTATSLPCMFSNLGRDRYNEKQAKRQENLIDVIRHAGFFLEWGDNNTGSKGIAARIHEIDMPKRKASEFCSSGGCFDGVFFNYLEEKIQENPGDMVLIVHQLGSHGPAYYERYPEDFESFKPACRTGELQDCSRQQVLNAYDNTILYTDYALNGIIERLQAKQAERDVAMLYVSDHGESTGEKGLYLHGAPYMIAPSQQTHVPMILWASEGFLQNRGTKPECLKTLLANPYSHDNFFHTVLGLLDIKTQVYEKSLDAFASCYANQ